MAPRAERSCRQWKGSMSAFNISISVCCDDSTHSYVPLHRWKAKQQLTVVMRTTISSAHNQVLSPVQFTVEYVSSNWRRHSKISPHTYSNIHCATHCSQDGILVKLHSTVYILNLKLAECWLVIKNDKYNTGPELCWKKYSIKAARTTLVDLQFIIFPTDTYIAPEIVEIYYWNLIVSVLLYMHTSVLFSCIFGVFAYVNMISKMWTRLFWLRNWDEPAGEAAGCKRLILVPRKGTQLELPKRFW